MDNGKQGRGEPERHHLVQAPVSPLDMDGLNVVGIGLVLFAAATGICLLLRDTLVARGDGWWLWVCVTGFGLGLLGLAYSAVRRSRRRAGTLSE
ncbi:MAG: DUF2530 domain-containing protein [Propionibacteriaceae bacterium]